jgi:hypothetical protein
VTTPASGWQSLDKDEHDQIWDRFEQRLEFRPSVDHAHWPGITEPVPSLTWDLASSRHDVDGRRSGQWSFGVDEDRFNRMIMNALQDCVPAGEWVYALDWQHPGYRLWPHQTDPRLPTDMWPIEAFPNGDYSIFTGPDLSFGTFGHPWEATLCVWGADLIRAVDAHGNGVLTRLYRRDGQPVSYPPQA